MSLDYSLIAGVYDELYGEEQAAKHKAVLTRLPPEEPVLDVGCGTGLLLEKLNCYFVGLDLSLEMLKIAAMRGRARHGDLVCGSAERMPFRKSSFQTIYSVTVLHEAPLALREILRVLRPDGNAAITILRKRIELLPEFLAQLPNVEICDDQTLKDVIVIFKRTFEI